MATMRRVGLFISCSLPVYSSLMDGIRSFCQTNGGWIDTVIATNENKMLNCLGGALDGIIAWVKNDAFAAALEAWSKPCVNVLSKMVGSSNCPAVGCDNQAIGRAGAQHLMGLGFKRLAFVGCHKFEFSRIRQNAFEATVRQAGGSCHVHQMVESATDWPSIWRDAAQWVSALPKPVGIMAANDSLAMEILNACHGQGIRVPAQVALLGVGNDKMLCQRARPPLSSIDQGLGRVGYQAAALLDDLMSGKAVPNGAIQFPPAEVVERASTDMLSLADPHVAKALQYIRENAYSPLQVKDILTVVPLSRRSLEQRFSQVLGRSLHEEIHRLRLQRAKGLLAHSHMSVEQVARASGFGCAVVMIRAFHKDLGVTPGEHRRRLGPVATAV